MLMNRKEMINWLIENKSIEEDTYVNVDRHLPKDTYIPMRYDGIFVPIGVYTIWDEVGGIASSGLVYRPVKGGTVLYEV